MFVKPSVTFLRLPLRSGTRTDCRMPPYVMIETDMPRVLVSVYLSIAVPSASAPKLDFEMRAGWGPPGPAPPAQNRDWEGGGDGAPAGWASRPAARPARTAHNAARWIRLDFLP